MDSKDIRKQQLDMALANADALAVANIALFDMTAANNRTRSALAGREAEIFAELSGETDEASGKAKFTNAETRKAEAFTRTEQDAICVTMRQQLIDSEAEIARKREEAAGLERYIKIRTAFLHGS